MIEDALVESARLIKNEFNSLNETLLGYEDDVRGLGKLFIKISEDLKNIGKNASKNDTIIDIKDKVMLKLNDLEIESDNICNRVAKINLKLEKLKKEENDLYVIIKKRHPSLSDDNIKIEIQKRIS